MPKFKEYNQGQLQLLPPDIRDIIPSDHICYVINDVVDNLDISLVEKTYSNGTENGGASAISPRLLLKAMFYSYSRGIRSSRLIEKRCREEIARWQMRMRKVLKQAHKIDKKENKKYGKERGYDQLPPRLADPDTRKKEIARVMAKMERLEQADEKIKEKQEKVKDETALVKKGSRHNNHNIVDEDANLMKLKNTKAVRPSYNGQIATSKQVITAYDVTGEAIDEPSLNVMIEKSEENTKEEVKTVKADCGYWSKENMEKLEEMNKTREDEIDAYIPDRRKSFEERGMRDGTLNKYHRNYFKYDEENDEFICPEGKRLKLKISNRDKHDKNKIISQRYFCEDCAGCKKKEKCTKAKRKQICVDWKLEEYKKTMRAKLNTKKGKQKYLERMYDVEPVFGNIKHNQRMENFLCRGKPMVKTEFGLTAIAHNFVKIANWLKIDNNREQFDSLMRLRAGS